MADGEAWTPGRRRVHEIPGGYAVRADGLIVSIQRGPAAKANAELHAAAPEMAALLARVASATATKDLAQIRADALALLDRIRGARHT